MIFPEERENGKHKMDVSTSLRMKIESDRVAAIQVANALSGVRHEAGKTLQNMVSGTERLSWYTCMQRISSGE